MGNETPWYGAEPLEAQEAAASSVEQESYAPSSIVKSNGLTYGVKRLSPVHKQIIALSAAGLKNAEIAETVGKSYAWVSTILNHPEAKRLRNELSSELVSGLLLDTQELIQAHTREAVDTVIHIMRHASKEHIQLQAAKDILDRGGFKPVERVQSTNLNLSAQDAGHITEALRQLNTSVPELIDVETTHEAFDMTKS